MNGCIAIVTEKNNKTENVLRFAIDAGETGMGSEHYYITDSHGTEYHLNLLSSNELNGSETNITYSGKLVIAVFFDFKL